MDFLQQQDFFFSGFFPFHLDKSDDDLAFYTGCPSGRKSPHFGLTHSNLYPLPVSRRRILNLL